MLTTWAWSAGACPTWRYAITRSDLESEQESDRSGRRPRLLFLSPTYADPHGNGLAMRAAMFVEALSQRFDVSLLVLPLFGRQSATFRELAERCCQRVFEIPVSGDVPRPVKLRFDPLPDLPKLVKAYAGATASGIEGHQFEVIHAFRFYMAPLALELARRSPRGATPELHVDLDDVESATHRSLADLYGLHERMEEAEAEWTQAKGYEEMERRLLPQFDRVYVCSEEDASRVRHLTARELRIVPNAVAIPPAVEPLTTHPFTFLFVGTLDYFPNEDALLYFCLEVLPMIRARSSRACLLRIVGRGYSPVVRQLTRIDGVRLIGEVENLTREYADADAVIAPIRAGGGMRIKVLEAFSYCRPVVSTGVGMEGIVATPDKHYLRGDSPRAFASQCLQLMHNPDLGQRLANAAFELVSQRYTHGNVAEAITGPS